MNVYAYVKSAPTLGVDPDGQLPDWHYFNRFGYNDGHIPRPDPNAPADPPFFPSVVLETTKWVDTPAAEEVEYWADWVSWGCGIPWAKMPKIFNWVKWIWEGLERLP